MIIIFEKKIYPEGACGCGRCLGGAYPVNKSGFKSCCVINCSANNTRVDTVQRKTWQYLKVNQQFCLHHDVIKWKHFPRYWPFVRGIHRSPVNSPHKGQWRGALMFYLFCAWINGWVNNGKAGDLRRHRTHYDLTVMPLCVTILIWK